MTINSEKNLNSLVPDKSQLHPAGTIEAQYKQAEIDLREYWDEKLDALDPSKTEEVFCSSCGTAPPPVGSSLFVKYGFPYYQCPLCFLIYPSPRPKTEYLEKQYKNGRFADSFIDIYIPSSEYRMKTIFRERVEEIIMPRVPNGKLLDIGCSSGHFLKVASDRGFEAYGIEPNPVMAKFAKEELGLPNIQVGVCNGSEFPGIDFDGISLWDVLEHVPNPHDLLLKVYDRLKPGGWVFAYTENVESFNVFITGGDSEIFIPDVHLRHYSPKTFRGEFEKAGFEVREVLTKGLDIQHIETTAKMYPKKYLNDNLRPMFEQSDVWQKIINISGKGDNLRLFAQKKF